MKINKPEIIRRLTERLGLEPGVVAPEMNLLPVSTLTTDLRNLLTDPKLIYLGLTDPLADGFYDVYTVPAGKRAKLYGARYERKTGAGLTFVQLSVGNRAGERIPLVFQAPDVTITWFCVYPMPTTEGWTVSLYISGYAAGNQFEGGLWVEEEDI